MDELLTDIPLVRIAIAAQHGQATCCLCCGAALPDGHMAEGLLCPSCRSWMEHATPLPEV
jgi:hypothetical protein